MGELRPVDCELLRELMKDSRRSDRQLAKAVRASQPTVTRRRLRLEKDFIEAYTTIPKFEKIGFELVAFTFVKSRFREAGLEEKEEARRKGKEWIMKQPNCIFAVSGQGMGWDDLCISFHKSYSDFAKFKRSLNTEGADFITDSESFIAVLDSKNDIKPFNFKYLAQAR